MRNDCIDYKVPPRGTSIRKCQVDALLSPLIQGNGSALRIATRSAQARPFFTALLAPRQPLAPGVSLWRVPARGISRW